MKKFTPFQKRIFTSVLVIALAFSGYVLSKAVEQQMRRNELSELLLKTQMIALLISPDDVEKLNGSEADNDNPMYHSLKKRFVEVKKINKDAEYIYLLGLNDQLQQFYFVGSELMTSGEYISPGTINQNATRNDIRDHVAGATHVSATYETPSGEWISAYAPVISEEGDVVAVVRVDVEAQKINLLINIISNGILLITSLIIFSLLLLYLHDIKRRHT